MHIKNMYLERKRENNRKEQKITTNNFKNTKFKTPDTPYSTHIPA